MRRKAAILSLLLLVVALAVGVFLVGQRTSFFGLAAPSVPPKQVKITNISDNSFTVSWVTDAPVAGFVAYGPTESLGNTTNDDRDGGVQEKRLTHHATIKNLDPGIVYFFKLGSGAKTYNNNGVAYRQKTASTTLDPPPVADPAFGKVLAPGGTAPKEALVYLTVAGGTPLSSYTRGMNWLITLNNTRSADLSNYISYKSEGDNIQIYVYSQDGVSTVTTDTKNHNPVPNITLGDTYNFAKGGPTSSFSLQNVENVTEASPLPSPSVSPSPKATVKPSATPRLSMPSTASGIPVSGAVENTILLFLSGVTALFAGTVMLARKPDYND